MNTYMLNVIKNRYSVKDTDIFVKLNPVHLSQYKWLKEITNIKKILPHNSGFDMDWAVQEDSDFYMLVGSYHAMDGNGSYSGWLNFVILIDKEIEPSEWYFKYEIEYDVSDLDYNNDLDDFENSELEEVDEDVEDEEKIEEFEYEDNRVNLESLTEYIEQTISESLCGIESLVNVKED